MSSHTRHLIRKATMIAMIGFGVLGGLFTAGYAWEDEGILKGSLLVASYAVPMVVVSILAWKQPRIALPLLLVGGTVVVVTSVLDASDPMRWRTIWDSAGPILAISGFAVSVPAAVYGYHQKARLAGAILLAVCGIPLFAGVLLGTQEGPIVGGSTSAGVLPGLVAGLILLLTGDDD